MERTTADSVWYAQTIILHCPYPRISGYWQAILTWNWCLRLRNRCGPIHPERWQVASHCLFIALYVTQRMQLSYCWQRDAKCYPKLGRIETHYLEGANLQFEVWNDHANLQWFMKWQDLNWRQAWWAQYLFRFNFKWVHKAGAQMGKPDALSGREDHAVEIQDDNKMVLVIPPEQIASTTLHIATDADNIRNHIRDAMVQIQESDVITLCKKHGICEDRDGLWNNQTHSRAGSCWSKGRPLSAALNGRLKSKGRDLVWQEWRWEISKWTRLGENQSSALGVYILSRGLHLCTLDLQISYAIVHEGNMRSIA